MDAATEENGSADDGEEGDKLLARPILSRETCALHDRMEAEERKGHFINRLLSLAKSCELSDQNRYNLLVAADGH